MEANHAETKLLFTVKPGFTTISPARNVVASFDREGRLFSYIEDGFTYRRTLASQVEVRWRAENMQDAPQVDEGQSAPRRRPPRQRGRLHRDEALQVFSRALDIAASLLPYAKGELLHRLENEIVRWTPESLLAEGERFARVYKPIPILPPDQYLSVVLQATEGCTWNKCTFCTFYQGRPFHVKSEAEFERHLHDVKAFFGRGISMRGSVFLGDGNALALSQRRLLPLMHMTREAFPDRPVYSFIDVYTGERKSVSEWKELADRGLHRVYIGMETGLDELLKLLNKPGSRDELVDFVHRLKAAGLLVGLIVMVGIGGVEYKQAHAAATLEAIDRMPLDAGDLVYLSPFIEQPGSTYVPMRESHGLTPMHEDEIEAELARLARHIRTKGLKAARYDIREFLY